MQGPALLVQEVAWVKMLVSYSQERGLKRGIIETFDGKHPCGMCKIADEMRQQGNESDEPAAPQKTRPTLTWSAMMISTGEFETPTPKCSDMPLVVAGWQQRLTGRGADGPEPPPPKWA